LLSWTYPEETTLEPRTRPLFEGDSDLGFSPDLWHYRRILCRALYPKGRYPSDISMVNWPQSDYFLGPIVGVSPAEKQRHLEAAR
jgi:hypothetical protein